LAIAKENDLRLPENADVPSEVRVAPLLLDQISKAIDRGRTKLMTISELSELTATTPQDCLRAVESLFQFGYLRLLSFSRDGKWMPVAEAEIWQAFWQHAKHKLEPDVWGDDYTLGTEEKES